MASARNCLTNASSSLYVSTLYARAASIDGHGGRRLAGLGVGAVLRATARRQVDGGTDRAKHTQDQVLTQDLLTCYQLQTYTYQRLCTT